MEDHVTGGVRGPDVEELDGDPLEIEGEPIFDRPRRRPQLDARKIPIRELPSERSERRIVAVRGRAYGLEHRRAFLAEASRAQAMRDDLRLGKQLVPPAVIAVGVRVEHAPRGFLPDAGILRDQVAGMG